MNEIPVQSNLILDVGCGGGWVSKSLISNGKKVISLDISEKNPIDAIKRVKHNDHAALISDVYNLPIIDNSIDCIIVSEVLEHVSDPKMFIEKLIRILKSKGTIIFTTPYQEEIKYQICVHCNKLTPQHAHLHTFNENIISHILPNDGVNWLNKKLINNYLLKLRIYYILKFLPFKIWKMIDFIANKLIFRPTRLMLIFTKD